MRGVFFTLLCALCALAHTASANTHIDATYLIYAGGLDVVEVKANYTLTPKAYDIELRAYTYGLLGKLAPWEGVLNTKGLQTSKAYLQPLDHYFSSTWRKQTERTDLKYNPDGSFAQLHVVDDKGNIKDTQPPRALTQNTRDMLTALPAIMQNLQNSGTCTLDVPAFDGRRKFIMRFKDAGQKTIRDAGYSLYAGPAHTCTVEIVPNGGKWHDKPRGWMSVQDQSKANGKLPKLWFAAPTDNCPLMPVRFEVYTRYGTFIMHLKDTNCNPS